MSEYSSGRLVHLSGPPGRIFSHRYFPCSQEISEVCLSGHRIRVYENSLWPRFGHQGFKKMCGSSSDAIKEWRDQSFIIKHHHHSTFIPRQAESNTDTLVKHLVRLGFKINQPKSCLTPAQEIVYLGLRLNSVMF